MCKPPRYTAAGEGFDTRGRRRVARDGPARHELAGADGGAEAARRGPGVEGGRRRRRGRDRGNPRCASGAGGATAGDWWAGSDAGRSDAGGSGSVAGAVRRGRRRAVDPDRARVPEAGAAHPEGQPEAGGAGRGSGDVAEPRRRRAGPADRGSGPRAARHDLLPVPGRAAGASRHRRGRPRSVAGGAVRGRRRVRSGRGACRLPAGVGGRGEDRAGLRAFRGRERVRPGTAGRDPAATACRRRRGRPAGASGRDGGGGSGRPG